MEEEVKEISNPLELLTEIEAFLCFKGMTEAPEVEWEELQQIRASIAFCLRLNGIETRYQPPAL